MLAAITVLVLFLMALSARNEILLEIRFAIPEQACLTHQFLVEAAILSGGTWPSAFGQDKLLS